MAGLGNMFNDPQMIAKLARNPKTSHLLADPQFMAKLQRLRQNPDSIGEEMADPRFLQVMGVLLGVDMQFGAPGEGGTEPKSPQEDTPMSDTGPSSSRSGEPPKAREPEPEPEPEPEDEEAVAKAKAKAEAEAEKKLGNELYKKREFDAAVEHYNKAWELHKDITYLTNLGAAKFEKGDPDGAIEACQKAIEEGREMLADFKLIAKYVVCSSFFLFEQIADKVAAPAERLAGSGPHTKRRATLRGRSTTITDPSPNTAPPTS